MTFVLLCRDQNGRMRLRAYNPFIQRFHKTDQTTTGGYRVCPILSLAINNPDESNGPALPMSIKQGRDMVSTLKDQIK